MHPHTPEETTAISDDLVLERLGYTPGMTRFPCLPVWSNLTLHRAETILQFVWNDRICLQRLDLVGDQILPNESDR